MVLVGHSRGGEGVNRASLDLPTDEGYHVTGQVLIGPTDFGFQAAPATPTVTILPYCDGDVSDLQGQNFTDDGRDVTADPTGDLAFHSSVLVMGADHNFFNTEWTPGSRPRRPSTTGAAPGPAPAAPRPRAGSAPRQQRKVGRAYIAGAVHLFADGDDSVLPMFDGSPVAVPSAGDADVRSHAIGGGLVTVRPGLDGSASADATAAVRLCDGVSDTERRLRPCQKRLGSVRAPHWPSDFFTGVSHRQFLEVGWTSAGASGGLDLDQPWDLSADSRLDLRTIVDPRTGPVHLAVSLTDADGHSAVLTPVGDGNLAPLPGGSYSLAKRWGQDLRVSLAGRQRRRPEPDHPGRPGVEERRRAGVRRRRLGDPGRRRLGRSDDAAPVVQHRHRPAAGGRRDRPGDRRRPVARDRGTSTTTRRSRSCTPTPFGFAPPSATQTLVVPAHTTGGVLHVRYRPNDLDDQGTRFLGLTAYAVSGLETDRVRRRGLDRRRRPDARADRPDRRPSRHRRPRARRGR